MHIELSSEFTKTVWRAEDKGVEYQGFKKKSKHRITQMLLTNYHGDLLPKITLNRSACP